MSAKKIYNPISYTNREEALPANQQWLTSQQVAFGTPDKRIPEKLEPMTTPRQSILKPSSLNQNGYGLVRTERSSLFKNDSAEGIKENKRR